MMPNKRDQREKIWKNGKRACSFIRQVRVASCDDSDEALYSSIVSKREWEKVKETLHENEGLSDLDFQLENF